MDNKDLIDLDGDFGNGSKNLPNSTAVLVLGIISIVTCLFYGVIGLVCGIIALVLFKKDNNLYNSNPSLYTEPSYKNLKAGQICAIIGLSLSALFILFMVFVFGAIFSEAAASGAFDR